MIRKKATILICNGLPLDHEKLKKLYCVLILVFIYLPIVWCLYTYQLFDIGVYILTNCLVFIYLPIV